MCLRTIRLVLGGVRALRGATSGRGPIDTGADRRHQAADGTLLAPINHLRLGER